MSKSWKSWKTLVSGLVIFLALLLGEVKKMVDNDPKTIPDWSIVISGLGALGLGWFARDDNVSSEGTTAEKDKK